MKENLKKFIRYIGYIFSYVFPYRIFTKCIEAKNLMYSGYIKRQFKRVGRNFKVESPICIYGSKYIQIGDNFISGARLRIEAYDKFINDFYNPQIIIGDNVNINFDCHIGCIENIQIGNGVLIAGKVLIIDHFHGNSTLESNKLPPIERPLISKGKISIGDNVWIGEGCVIMPGVKIGANCVIGANSVVTKDFEANCIIGGNPAKLIKHFGE